MLKHLSLFSGIGGFDLAAEWIGWENVAHCELDPFCRKTLNYYWPKATSHENIIQTDFTVYRGRIDIITGGFPCQPFSVAGNRSGTNDDRYLWPEYLRAIREIQPTFVIAENVTGILSMEEREVFVRVDSQKCVRLDYIDEYEKIYTRQASLLLNSICIDLEKEGYSVQPVAIPAAGIGAPHRRDRVWIIAYSDGNGHNQRGNRLEKDRSKKGKSEKEREERKRVWNEFERNDDPETVTNPGGTKLQRRKFHENKEKTGCGEFTGSDNRAWTNFPTQPPVCDGNDGISSGLDGITFSNWRNQSLRAAGNAVVPQVPHEIFKAIEIFLKQ